MATKLSIDPDLRALVLNDGGLGFLKSDPLMARRPASRYAVLLKKLGLPE